MTARQRQGQAIDAVITWVDGNDPNHLRKRQLAANSAAGVNTQQIPAGKDPTRFIDNGELRYCLASLHRFAPWIRHIHLITDSQRPAFLDDNFQQQYKVTVVDHREVFRDYEWALPTYNSRSIETVMWRAPELADRFIYLNDDFVLTRPLEPGEFFAGDKVILRGAWKSLRLPGAAELTANRAINRVAKTLFGVTRTMHLLAQKHGALLAGARKRYFRSSHVPHPMKRDTLAEFYRLHPEALENNIRFAFRDTSQYLPVSLANHLEILRGNAHLVGTKRAALISGERQFAWNQQETLTAIRQGKLDFLCLGSIEKFDSETRRQIDITLSDLLDLDSQRR